ncbi:MAG: IclR family transcriptional regulator [Microbacterium sp.]
MANSPSGESVTERIVRVLETFDADRAVQTVAEVSRRAELPPSTGHRMVADLVDSGLLERDDAGRIRLGLRLWELAQRGSQALRLRQIALPHMEHVQARLREHTQLAVLEQDEALFLERLSNPRAVSNITRIAGRLPLHASSSGLVLLAHADDALRERVLSGPLAAVGPETVTDPDALRPALERIRRDGVAIAPGSIEDVSTGIAVPVRDGKTGPVIAALSVVIPRAAPTAGAVDELRSAAIRISGQLTQPPQI